MLGDERHLRGPEHVPRDADSPTFSRKTEISEETFHAMIASTQISEPRTAATSRKNTSAENDKWTISRWMASPDRIKKA